jgi:UDP-N-acetylmuramate--alanine ligase
LIQLSDIKKVYFIGIGGIGMSALARYFKSRGTVVSGYDKTVTPLTRQLEAEAIDIHYDEQVSDIPLDVQLVVYTPAVPKDHKELVYYQEHKFLVLKRSEVLGIISNSSFNICVGGTHGKTTITTMVAHVLRSSGYGCNAFLGGISGNYQTNFWSHERNVCVIEADEYDRSFLRLSPDIAIISSMDADHLDIYGTEEALQDAFVQFGNNVKKGGLLLNKWGLKRGADLRADQHLTYHLQDKNADVYAADIKMVNGSYEFDVMGKEGVLKGVILNMGGMHNVENAIAAIGVARHLGIDGEKIKEAIGSFKGVKRRFEYIMAPGSNALGIIMVDDYAHHPEELRALITGAKTLFSGSKCTVVFQPHLYSRTNDLADDFARSLDLADDVILLPIYPARELPLPGVNSDMIATRMKNKGVKLMTKEQVMEWVGDGSNRVQLLITAGAGDIDAMVAPIAERLGKVSGNELQAMS